MELSYFPGCSLHSTASEYDASTRAVCEALGIGLRELEDWNCCGSTSAHSINAELAMQLPMRNLEIAEKAGLDLMVPCAACYSRSKMAEVELAAGDGAEGAFSGRVQINHILEVLAGVTPFATGSIERLLRDESSGLSWGATLVIVTAVVTDELRATLTRLREAGRRLVLVGVDYELPKPPPGVLCHHVPLSRVRRTEDMLAVASRSAPAIETSKATPTGSNSVFGRLVRHSGDKSLSDGAGFPRGGWAAR